VLFKASFSAHILWTKLCASGLGSPDLLDLKGKI